FVLAETAAVLGHPDASHLSPHTGFVDLGLDSLMAAGLRQRLLRATGLSLPATLAFDHPSPGRVATFLYELLAPALGELPRAVPRAMSDEALPRASLAAADSEPVAVVGMGLHLPGGATDLDGLWRLLEQGTDAVGPVPADRWNADAHYDPDPD